MQNRVNIPLLCQQVAPARHLLDLLRIVTAGVSVLRHCSERYTMKHVFWLVEPMWNRGISPKSTNMARGESVKYRYVKPSSPHLSLFHRYKYRNLNFLLSPLFLPIYFHIVPHRAGILQSNKIHLAIGGITLPIV